MNKYSPDQLRSSNFVLNKLGFDARNRVVKQCLVPFVADLVVEGQSEEDIARAMNPLKPLLNKTIEELTLIRQRFIESETEE